MPNIDERELCRMFSSKEFLIPTRQIVDLHAQIDEWIQTNSPGGIIWGHSRCGKSSAVFYIVRSLKSVYGSELPVYIYTATNHVATQKAFYERMLMALGHPDASKGTANQMRQRLVNRIIADSLNTKYKMCCLFIDEAYLLTTNEYTWLCDLYNEAAISDIQLTCLLISTKEILDVKKGFIRAGKQQIVQRLMLKEAEFHGIESLTDLYICMNALDNNFTPQGYDEPICLSETYFPDAHRDGKNLASFSQAFWTAMQNLRHENHINANYMTMKCFMDSVSYCLRKFGVDSGDNRVYEPSIAEWEACLIASGYVSSQV